MTVIRPNSIAGINSITVQTGQALNIHDASGNIIRNLTSSSGVSTYQALHVGSGTTTSTQGISVGTGCSIISETVNTLDVYTAASKRLTIDSSGRVQIGGVTGPNSAKLFVSGTNSTSYVTLRNTSAGDGSGARWNSIRFQGTQSGGEVSDLVQLQANHDGTSDDEKGSFQILVNDGNDGDSLQERLRITSAGLVGIGIDPTARLHVNGVSTADIITARAADSNGNSIINILSEGTTGSSRINFSDTAGIDGQVSYSHSARALIFATAGTTERLRISSEGYVTKPYHPNFCARKTDTSSYNASDIIIYNDVSSNFRKWNIGGHYSTTTGKFTAPIAGIYYFEAQAMTTGWSNNDLTQDLLFLNSNNSTLSYPRQRRSRFQTSDDDNGYFTNSVAGQAQLAVGDTVWVQLNRACSVTSESFSYFTGWLVQ